MITATILTKNNADTLRRTLDSTKFLSEVLIVDTGSTDETLKIAEEYDHVKIFTHDFIGFGPLHNFAASKAKFDWILSIDSDEALSLELQKKLRDLNLDPYFIYSFPFHNFFNGKHIKGCGWYPDRHIRLYHRKKTSFSEDIIHEKILQKDLKEKKLTYPIEHYSYRSIADFLKKMERYSTLFADQYQGKRKSSVKKALFHGMFAFIKSYFLKRGFLSGSEGLIISYYNAHTAFYKYLKLEEANRKRCY